MKNLGRNGKNSSRMHACCFVNNTVTYFNLFVCPFELRGMSNIKFFNFDLFPYCAWLVT